MRVLALVSLFLVSLHVYFVDAEARTLRPGASECSNFTVGGKGSGRLKGSVCIYGADRSANPDVLYFFHGVTGNATNWGDSEYLEYVQVRERWKENHFSPPTVISVSFGPTWILTAPWKQNPGLYRVFVDDVMPRLESHIGGLGQGRRIVLGTSMGGYNAAALYLHNPELFDRFALACPAISTLSPYAPKADLYRFSRRTGANPIAVYHFMGVAGDLIGDERAWPSNDTLAIARKTLGDTRPPLYVSCGNKDELGFFEGSSRFVELVKRSGSPIYWRPLQGGHCVMDPVSLADFLQAK